MFTTLVAVAVLHWIGLVLPGPNVLVVSHLAATGNRRGALAAAVGISVCAIFWALVAVLGVNAIFAAHPSLRLALQVAGGLYLCWIALRLWRAPEAEDTVTPIAASAGAGFRVGALTNLMNPKSALFFSSVFVTAIPPERDLVLMAAIVALVWVNALLWYAFLAIAFSHPRIRAGYARRRRILARTAGALLGAFGLRLLLVHDAVACVMAAGEVGRD